MQSLQNCVESQTVVGDLARVRVPVEVVYGTIDAFIAPGSLTVIEAMRHVTMHRVEANDHLIRKRLARVVAAACDASSGQNSSGQNSGGQDGSESDSTTSR